MYVYIYIYIYTYTYIHILANPRRYRGLKGCSALAGSSLGSRGAGIAIYGGLIACRLPLSILGHHP